LLLKIKQRPGIDQAGKPDAISQRNRCVIRYYIVVYVVNLHYSGAYVVHLNNQNPPEISARKRNRYSQRKT